MVTLSEHTEQVLKAWNGEPCPECGLPMFAYNWDEAGVVWSCCNRCDRDVWTAYEPRGGPYDPEPVDPEELPF